MENEEKTDETAEEVMEEKPRRLCSEIQLFDLCERESCKFKEGRYCTDEEMLRRFEAIKEEDDRSSERFLSEDYDEESEEEFDDSLENEEYDDDSDDD